MSKPTAISTFSGPGGSSLGYERAGYRVLVALDSAPEGFHDAILTTYKQNHPETTLIAKDAKETDADELLDAADLEVGDLDLLDGSPPCSPFSGANTKLDWGDHQSGTLFDRYAYFVDRLEPKTFVAENVPGLAEGDTKGYFKVLLDTLENAGPGYTVRVQKIDSAYLGAPHHRRRLIFIGTRSDLPDPPKIQPNSRPTTVREAWDDLDNDPKQKDEMATLMANATHGDAKAALAPGQYLVDVLDGGRVGFTHSRLSWRKPAKTMTAKRGEVVHPEEDRYLTIPEVRRLIGLPDSYWLPDQHMAAWESAVRCLPPVLTETIGEELLDILP